MDAINIIGAGLAGCEAAYQLAKRELPVRLYDMKPHKKSPAHTTDRFCELVCSNSLRSNRLSNAVGLLKEEMRRLDSLVMRAADATCVPAGGALAVDRTLFSEYVTQEIRENPKITVFEEEITDLEELLKTGKTIVAAGPLASPALSGSISKTIGSESLYFFDAAAPIVDGKTIDFAKAFYASRYERGNDYINCPMTQQEYYAFYEALRTAECAEIKDFEHNVFEGCMPIEEIARRGPQTMCFGPLKPKGIVHPDTGVQPYANVQLRRENAQGSMFNIVGFQTHLKFPEQVRVFRMIPGLEHAEFLRYGVMHRNTYIHAPGILDRYYRCIRQPELFFAGQITGVEGYVESASSGLLAGLFCACDAVGIAKPDFTSKTAIGALARYISQDHVEKFQPMNVNYGIMMPLKRKIRNKEQKNLEIARIALEEIECLKEQPFVR